MEKRQYNTYINKHNEYIKRSGVGKYFEKSNYFLLLHSPKKSSYFVLLLFDFKLERLKISNF